MPGAGVLLRAACDPLDFLAHQSLDQHGKIVVEPIAQHRLQHLLGHVVEGLLAARGKCLGQFAEGCRDLALGLFGQECRPRLDGLQVTRTCQPQDSSRTLAPRRSCRRSSFEVHWRRDHRPVVVCGLMQLVLLVFAAALQLLGSGPCILDRHPDPLLCRRTVFRGRLFQVPRRRRHGLGSRSLLPALRQTVASGSATSSPAGAVASSETGAAGVSGDGARNSLRKASTSITLRS